MKKSTIPSTNNISSSNNTSNTPSFPRPIIGIIGGSGVYNLEGVITRNKHFISTPYGEPSGPILEGEIQGIPFLFLPRHGYNHTISPSEINYCANIYALKALGVHYLLSFSAVGSLSESLPPGTFVAIDQFFDATKGLRRRSFFGEGIVGHVSCAYPIDSELQKILFEECQKHQIPSALGGTYVCIEGPTFSTRAESFFYRSLSSSSSSSLAFSSKTNASVIGMTNVPEAFLAKEAGISYATMAMVTDFDCWTDHHCTVEEIVAFAQKNTQTAQRLIPSLLEEIHKNPPMRKLENQNAVMTHKAAISEEKQKILDVLLT